MMDGFRADPDTLARHGATLQDYADRMDTVTQAANQPLSPDAYGLICGFLSGTTNNAESLLRTSIDLLASVVRFHAGGVDGCATDYRDADNHLATMFGGGR
jgi:hypothetical protein